MDKITINDKEYTVADFNEEQQKAYQEIMMASAELDRITYVGRTLDARRQALAAFIEQAANKPDEES
jgi:hypothetical protein